MKTIKGPAIFLAQFCGDESPFNNLKDIAKWASGLGYKAVQIPTPMLLNKALISSGLSSTKLYHLNEKPTKGNPTISELLKDKKESINKGP